MDNNNEALMRSWASVALKNEGYDHRRDAVARFILKNVDDPYEEIEVGSAWIVKTEDEERVAVRGKTTWYLCETDDSFSSEHQAVEVVSELVPKSTPDHPAELAIAAEYLHAPTGTVVAAEDGEAWTKNKDGYWETWGIISGYDNYAMADEARQVLRWGWEA